MKPLVYVAGPITGDPWGCVRTATKVAAALSAAGAHAVLPQLSVLHEMIDPQPYEHWIEHGLTVLERCDGLYRILGESPGADREVAHAMALAIPCLLESNSDATTLDDWVESIRVAGFRRRVVGAWPDGYPCIASSLWSESTRYAIAEEPS